MFSVVCPRGGAGHFHRAAPQLQRLSGKRQAHDLGFCRSPILLVVAIVGIITITVSICFDFTKYLSDRGDRQKDKLKVVCSHTELIDLAEGTYVQPLFSQVPGKATYQYDVKAFPNI